jgi:hypothetical protein
MIVMNRLLTLSCAQSTRARPVPRLHPSAPAHQLARPVVRWWGEN